MTAARDDAIRRRLGLSPSASERVLAEAEAMLSEGWCPICGTKFRPSDDGGEPRCGSAMRLDTVRREVAACRDLGRLLPRSPGSALGLR